MQPRRIFTVLAAAAAASCASSSGGGQQAPAGGPGPRVVQPGAPGQGARAFDGDLAEVQGAAYTDADVAFMQGMIHHHAQALEMTALVEARTQSEGFRRMALRMEISQGDEIAMMQTWLRERGRDVPEVGMHGMMHGGHTMMPGMLSEAQMASLRAARGDEFERLFLEYMIQHHQGAITMVHDLFDTPGAAQESTINFFANEVDADQTIEIDRMQQMLDRMR